MEVETDSELAFKMITRKTTEAWRYSRTIRNIRNLHMPHAKVQFTVRVSNKVADALAKLAYAIWMILSRSIPWWIFLHLFGKSLLLLNRFSCFSLFF